MRSVNYNWTTIEARALQELRDTDTSKRYFPNNIENSTQPPPIASKRWLTSGRLTGSDWNLTPLLRSTSAKQGQWTSPKTVGDIACSQGSQEQFQRQRAQHQGGKHHFPHYEVQRQDASGCHGMTSSRPRPNIHQRDQPDHNWWLQDDGHLVGRQATRLEAHPIQP